MRDDGAPSLDLDLHSAIVSVSCSMLTAIQGVLRPSPIDGCCHYLFTLRDISTCFQVTAAKVAISTILKDVGVWSFLIFFCCWYIKNVYSFKKWKTFHFFLYSITFFVSSFQVKCNLIYSDFYFRGLIHSAFWAIMAYYCRQDLGCSV